MTFQLQVFDDSRQQRAGAAGQCRATKAGMNSFSNAPAADNLASLQNHRFQSGLCQIGRRDQAVVPGADYDDFVSRVH